MAQSFGCNEDEEARGSRALRFEINSRVVALPITPKVVAYVLYGWRHAHCERHGARRKVVEDGH